ncbi:hypothetical protein [Kallotenue papyrolyticum]|uniref:hypothetical protein n=1 Tax=Kallotenue papyrolyticum TaxID=1325125 RepID=UPI0004785CF7|nr:hypothetical protein [Kallotenue papyrolyticum]
MVERLCPLCNATNAPTQTHCAGCGAALEQPLRPRRAAQLTRRAPRLPARWQRHGRLVALGLATLAADVALAWLQHRQQLPVPRPATPAAGQAPRPIALGRRVSEVWQNGQLQQRVEEQIVWFAPRRGE